MIPNNTENIEKALRILQPRIVLWLTWVAVIIVTMTGIALSIKNNCWSPLTKSGSAIVILALLLALVDFSGWANTILQIIVPKDRQLNPLRIEDLVKQEIIADLQKYNIKKSDDEIEYLVHRELKQFKSIFPFKLGLFAKGVHIPHEIVIASLGTLISGFGDVIGELFMKGAC